MKKFSNISGYKVSEEPKAKPEVKINEEELFRGKVMNLMDQLLSIRTYGPIDRYLRAGNIKVAGKEMFLEALMDLLKDKSSKDEKKILESLKSQIKDWEAIDSKIDEVEKEVSDFLRDNDLSDLLSLWQEDVFQIKDILEKRHGAVLASEQFMSGKAGP